MLWPRGFVLDHTSGKGVWGQSDQSICASRLFYAHLPPHSGTAPVCLAACFGRVNRGPTPGLSTCRFILHPRRPRSRQRRICPSLRRGANKGGISSISSNNPALIGGVSTPPLSSHSRGLHTRAFATAAPRPPHLPVTAHVACGRPRFGRTRQRTIQSAALR
ncbi:hypothetical protein K458DRAFT_55566 [Lentithecium fluviatile CBS 122367]|uniref:Uncharacterized protein n=1 Tax=Lentithecium fluviatile CBS 122367 TaxID=1168545 RepID=A0A6G1IY20_9PLEO|nr:hypothetical protein K458DRAFT_55566 [Lentithecium fluviatile CBS 122367]